MYTDRYSDELIKIMTKLKIKDQKQYQILRRKINWILANPLHKYKDLHHSMSGFKRVHLGHFVLVFTVDYSKKIVIFDDYDHHDKIYKA